MFKAVLDQTNKELKPTFDYMEGEEGVQGMDKRIDLQYFQRRQLTGMHKWNGDTLLPPASKVLSRILINRIQTVRQGKIFINRILNLRKRNQGFVEGEGLQSGLYPPEYPGASQRVECHLVLPFCEKTFESVHGDSLRTPPPKKKITD